MNMPTTNISLFSTMEGNYASLYVCFPYISTHITRCVAPIMQIHVVHELCEIFGFSKTESDTIIRENTY